MLRPLIDCGEFGKEKVDVIGVLVDNIDWFGEITLGNNFVVRFAKKSIYGTIEYGVPPDGRFLADWLLGMQPAANTRLIIICIWVWWLHYRWSWYSQEQGIQGLSAHASCKNWVNLGVGNPEPRAHASHLHPPLAFWRSPMCGRWDNCMALFVILHKCTAQREIASTSYISNFLLMSHRYGFILVPTWDVFLLYVSYTDDYFIGLWVTPRSCLFSCGKNWVHCVLLPTT